MLIRYLMVLTMVLIFSITSVASVFAGWLIYHKPAFKGKVIDAEMKEPIEGAMVVIYKAVSLKALNMEDKI